MTPRLTPEAVSRSLDQLDCMELARIAPGGTGYWELTQHVRAYIDQSASRIARLEARLAASEAALTDCRTKGDNALRDVAKLEVGFTAALANADHARERFEVERAENAALKGEVERLKRCMSMAMGCLDNFSDNKDERLAWYRLLDGTEGREARAALAGEE